MIAAKTIFISCKQGKENLSDRGNDSLKGENGKLLKCLSQ